MYSLPPKTQKKKDHDDRPCDWLTETSRAYRAARHPNGVIAPTSFICDGQGARVDVVDV